MLQLSNKMKKQLLILATLIIAISSCKVKKELSDIAKLDNQTSLNYDKDYVDYIKQKWEKTIIVDIENPKFNFQESFRKTLSKKDESILSNDFLEKPSSNDLLAHYIDNKLQWNSFNRGFDKKTIEEIIQATLKESPTENEMLAFYYKSIFAHILNNQRNIEPYEKNIELGELNLDETQQTILFLSAMKMLGGQIFSYSNARFPENCHRQHTFMKKIPRFNGMEFYEYSLMDYQDFKLKVDKRYPKQSFKENYEPNFYQAIEGYEKCKNK